MRRTALSSRTPFSFASSTESKRTRLFRQNSRAKTPNVPDLRALARCRGRPGQHPQLLRKTRVAGPGAPTDLLPHFGGLAASCFGQDDDSALAGLIALSSTMALADCLSEAKEFAIGLCGDLERSGIKVTASGNLQGEADLNTVIKRFPPQHFGARGKLKGIAGELSLVGHDRALAFLLGSQTQDGGLERPLKSCRRVRARDPEVLSRRPSDSGAVRSRFRPSRMSRASARG
jgi:hypothetical protein